MDANSAGASVEIAKRFSPVNTAAVCVVCKTWIASRGFDRVLSAGVHELVGGVWYRWLLDHDGEEDS